jgi:hypothetical protein
VDDVYAASKEAEANVSSWIKAEKIGDVRVKVEEVSFGSYAVHYTANESLFDPRLEALVCDRGTLAARHSSSLVCI